MSRSLTEPLARCQKRGGGSPFTRKSFPTIPFSLWEKERGEEKHNLDLSRQSRVKNRGKKKVSHDVLNHPRKGKKRKGDNSAGFVLSEDYGAAR